MAKTYALLGDEGQPLDAHVSFREGALIVHSRGGTKGKNAHNADYSVGLRLLLSRLKDADVSIEGAWVDSNTVQTMPLSEREILRASEGLQPAEEIQRLLTTRMKSIRSGPNGAATGGNSTRRILIQTGFHGGTAAFASLLGCSATNLDTGSDERLPIEELIKVTPVHVWAAVQQFASGPVLACAALEDALKRYAISQALDASDKSMQDVVNLLKAKGLIAGAQKTLLDAMPRIRNHALHVEWSKLSEPDVNGVIGFVEQFLMTKFSQ